MKSLVIHPASTTHSQLNDEELAEQQIYQNTIRLSIGTEHIDDIIADLQQAFEAAQNRTDPVKKQVCDREPVFLFPHLQLPASSPSAMNIASPNEKNR